MAIAIRCGECRAALKVGEQLAGKTVKCPKCSAKIAVAILESAAVHPAPVQPIVPPDSTTPGKVPSDPAELRKLVMSGFKGDVKRVRTPVFYKLGILLAAAVMVVLPLVYLAFIALVGYGVYYHLANHGGMVTAVRGRAVIVALLAYIAPAVVGAIMVLFMFKPFFAPPGRKFRTRSLTRAGEPLVFEFVERICKLVGAPMPARIDINADVNASASFRRGLWSMIVGNDLVLTLGIPLVSGFKLENLAGVLAHEFGHFSQGLGMRLSYIVWSLNAWFARVVYERDGWDEWLEETSTELDLRVAWILWLARLGVWFSRRVLWVLMMIGLTVTSFLSRQMEYDADRYEARIGGSDVFEASTRRLCALQLGFHISQMQLFGFLKDAKMPDNLSRLLQLNLKHLKSEIDPYAQKAVDEGRTGLFDTHPCDRDRIANARREKALGAFQSNLPARVLFRNFEDTSRKVTYDLYAGWFGKKLKREALDSTEELYDSLGINPTADPAPVPAALEI